MLLEEFVQLWASLAQRVLEGLVVLVHWGVQGSSISIRGPSTIRGSSIIRGSSSRIPSSFRISSSSRRPSIPIRISSLFRWPSTLTWISSSFRGSLIPLWSPISIFILTTLIRIFPSLQYGGPLNICASLGTFSFCKSSIF